MKISRQAYADMYGPTVGDKVRLADTELWIEVEHDFTTYGEEVKFGGGKVIRDGMGQSQLLASEVVDTLITNALIIDHWGIVKADVGLKNGRIHAIGKAGNPDIQPNVTIAIGASTEVIAGEGMILTAGGIDTHIHYICPPQIPGARGAGRRIGSRGRAGTAADHRGHARHQRLLNLLRADEMDVAVDAAGGGNQTFAGDGLGAGTDDDVHSGLHVGVTGFADPADAAVLDPDVGLDDAPVIHDQRVGNHGIHRALGLRPLRLAHAVADHLAAAKFHFLAVNRVVALDFDPQLGIAQPDPVAGGGTVHVRVGAAVDAAHGRFSSGPMMAARKP